MDRDMFGYWLLVTGGVARPLCKELGWAIRVSELVEGYKQRPEKWRS